MERGHESSSKLLNQLGINPFQQRLPWIGGDLQTLRDTIKSENLSKENSKKIYITVPPLLNKSRCKEQLLALFDAPKEVASSKGIVLILHGLGGSSERQGVRRMANILRESNFTIIRLNLRGAYPGRDLASGTYSAKCNSDIFPVINIAKELCKTLGKENKESKGPIPLIGIGISLGGTILLNACASRENLIDILVCTSSPLDLGKCSSSIERKRNIIYQTWLLNRLIKQTLADPFRLNEKEEDVFKKLLSDKKRIKSIRDFDQVVTAPRWGYKNVDEYYLKASPISDLMKNPNIFPRTLFLQSLDDPWVPAETANKLERTLNSNSSSNLTTLITKNGGHNGFHGINGCWGDQLVRNWIEQNLI